MTDEPLYKVIILEYNNTDKYNELAHDTAGCFEAHIQCCQFQLSRNHVFFGEDNTDDVGELKSDFICDMDSL